MTPEPLLAELRAAGTLDSLGVFTLRADRAAGLLRRCRLPAPELALLKLVQARVAAGATRVDLEVHPFGVELRSDGPAPRKAQLEDLEGYLLEDSEEPLRELALALNDCRSWAGRVEVAAPGGRRVWQGARSWTEACREGFRVRLHRTMADLVRGLLPGGPAGREVLLLRRTCGWSPAPVRLNGALLEAGEGRPFAEAYVTGEGAHAVGAPTTSRAWLPPRVPRRALGRGRIPCRAVLALGPWDEGCVRVVRHGVACAEESGPPGLRALVSGDGLAFDLAGLRVVHDRAWEERKAWLAGEARALAADLARKLDRLPRSERARADQLLAGF